MDNVPVKQLRYLGFPMLPMRAPAIRAEDNDGIDRDATFVNRAQETPDLLAHMRDHDVEFGFPLHHRFLGSWPWHLSYQSPTIQRIFAPAL